MIRELVTDEEILSRPCEKVEAEDPELVQDLIDTLAATEEGCCIAANQIGVTKAVCVYLDESDETPHVMYNPKILLGLGPDYQIEGCLTREEPTRVKRFKKVKVSYDEPVDGELKPRKRNYTGWTAQMVQHMVDHCHGKLV